jgi:hypothetical protein
MPKPFFPKLLLATYVERVAVSGGIYYFLASRLH